MPWTIVVRWHFWSTRFVSNLETRSSHSPGLERMLSNVLFIYIHLMLLFICQDAEFVSYQSHDSLCKVNNGQLNLQPKLQINEAGFDRIHYNINLNFGMKWVLDFKWNINYKFCTKLYVISILSCTPIADRDLECSRQAWAYQILPPIVSCKLNTRESFRFIYGRIEIRAKLPKGDWLFPGRILPKYIRTIKYSPSPILLD